MNSAMAREYRARLFLDEDTSFLEEDETHYRNYDTVHKTSSTVVVAGSYADDELQILSHHITRTRGPARPLVAARQAIPIDSPTMAQQYGIAGLVSPRETTRSSFFIPLVLFMIISLLSVLVLCTPHDKDATESAITTAQKYLQEKPVDLPPPDFDEDSLPLGGLPPGDEYTKVGKASWHVVPPPRGNTLLGTGLGKVFSYTVEIENGIYTPIISSDERAFGAFIDSILNSEHGWIHEGKSFRRIGAKDGDPDFRISLTTPETTRKYCGFSIKVESSCYLTSKTHGHNRVYLNLARWIRGAKAYRGDYINYRIYQVNHEVGHAIGYPRHKPCEKNGALAPVMMQQTYGIANNDIDSIDPSGVVPRDGKVCRPNPWPYPPQ